MVRTLSRSRSLPRDAHLLIREARLPSMTGKFLFFGNSERNSDARSSLGLPPHTSNIGYLLWHVELQDPIKL